MEVTKALEMGGKAAQGAGGMAGEVQSKFSFAQVGGKDSIAGVESAANAAIAASQQAPQMAVNFAMAGVNAGVAVTKTILAATGAGAKISMAIDGVQTAINKGVEKLNQAGSSGAAVNKAAAPAGAGGGGGGGGGKKP